MKQYAQVARTQFSSKQSNNEPFFEPQPFFKKALNATNEPLQFKWFAPSSNHFFLLAINGFDAQLIADIKGLLKSRAKLTLDDCGAKNPSEMMETFDSIIKEYENLLKPQSCHSAENTSILPVENNTDFLAHVNEKIEENLSNEHFRHTDLAKLLCCCEMQLYRKIKLLSKLSPANYIRRYRLRRSLRSLQSSDLPISQICFNMGFRSLEYFSRSFKKEFGVCPSDFRSGQNVEIVQMNV